MSKPKIYELWFNDYDGGSSYQFTHPNNKLNVEFQQDCEDVLREFAGEYINQHESWIGTSDLISLIADKLPSRGYIPFGLTFENVSFGMGGSCIIEKRDHDDGTDAMRKLLGKALLSKVYAKNKSIHDSLLSKHDNL